MRGDEGPGSGRRQPYRGKRAFDLVVVALAAVPAAVLAAGCGVAVKLSSQGPVLFRQTRVGRDGRTFSALKFRTMRDAPEGNPLFPDDDRITPVGRVLRRLSLDELPQLLNVVRSEMSVVGPRPAPVYQVTRYDDRQRRRLAVRPGLTGLAQVRGRNQIYWAERIEHDLEYLDRQTIWLDLRILAKTCSAVVAGSGGHPRDDPIARPPAG